MLSAVQVNVAHAISLACQYLLDDEEDVGDDAGHSTTALLMFLSSSPNRKWVTSCLKYTSSSLRISGTGTDSLLPACAHTRAGITNGQHGCQHEAAQSS